MKAPNGSQIVGTDELIPGTALGGFKNDGSFEHDGETEVGWDGQETRTIGGQTVYVDDDGDVWLECELIADDANPIPDDQIKPWHANQALVQIEVANTLRALVERCDGDPEQLPLDRLTAELASAITHRPAALEATRLELVRLGAECDKAGRWSHDEFEDQGHAETAEDYLTRLRSWKES